MMSASIFSILEIVAPIASIFVLTSPLPTIRTINDNRSVGSLPLLPYSSMVASTYVWCLYGIMKQEPSIWSSNAIGFLLGLYYFYSFQRYSPKVSSTLPGSISQHIQGTIFIIILATLLPFVTKRISETLNQTEMLGNFAVLLCIAMFASPLAAVRSVLNTKSSRSIPLPFTITSIVNCMLWAIIGWFQMRDANVYVPNGLGLMFGIIQLALKLVYPETGSDKIDGYSPSKREAKDIGV